MPTALTVTVSPNDPGTFVNPYEALPFFTALQSHWQPLALLQPPELPALVPVITWYIDHIRFPQCFQPRLVLLNHNPADWIQRLRSVWVDLILPQQLMHVHIVQPPPPEMPMHVAAHLLIVQQSIEQFRAVLITTYDSALPDEPPINHASITPTPVAFSTVIALAYRDTVCQPPNVDCAVWVGEEELPQPEERHVINGHSLVVAVHRHNQPMPAGGTEWDLAQMHHRSGSHGSSPPPAYAKQEAPSSVIEKGNRVLLQLEAVLPPMPTKRTLDDSQPQLLWFANEAWLFKLSRAPPCKLHALPEGLRLPDACYWPLIHPTPSDNPTHQLTLYLDGAANGTHAAWSVIATINLPIGEVFIGCMHGCVHLEPAHPQWIGADAMDNIAAELSALAMAQTCALRWPYSDHQICIRPDLSLSRTVANAITTCRSNAKLAQLCLIQGLWLASKTQILEIRGHQGYAWNELADTVAKWALVQGSHDAEPSICALHEFATHDHDVAWAWMKTTHPALSACFPCLIDQQVMQFTPSTMRVQGAPTEPKHGGCPDQNHAQWSMTVITANVLAAEVWNTQAQGSRRTGQRTLRLDHQWHRHGAHIIGVQEARTAAGQYHSPHYRIFASGATVARAPLYGCELWIHKTQPIAHDAQGTPIILGDAKVTIRHADPRRLVAVASIGQVHYTFVVLHAPCQATQSTDNQSNGDVVAEWWTATSAIWHSTVTTELCWVLLDANAPIDGEHGHHTGPLGAENPSKAGTAFMQFLVDNDLAVPSTFPHIHKGQTATWSHATGKQSRKDYIAIKAKMMQLATQSWVDIHHDNTFAHDDHLPVILSCKGWQQLKPSTAASRWDAEKLLDPTCCQSFQQALNTLPIPHWSVDVDDHAAIQEAQLLQLGQKFFAKAPCRSHKITLQPDTLALIALKRQALDYGRAHQELNHPPFKAELRQLEKLVHCKVRRDTQVFYDALLDRLDRAGELHNHRLMYQVLTRLGRKKGGKAPGPRPLPMLKKEDGSFAATFDEQQQMWMTQFAAVEAGVPCSWPQLQQRHREDSEDHQVKVHEIDPAAFPTVWQIQSLLSQLKRDKVPGPNHLPPALLKAGGEVMARHLTILFTKAAAAAREPLLWKGGTLIPLWKGKDSPDLPSAYRSIFVSNYSTKLYHQFIRQHLVAVWEQKADHLQCGGRKGVGVDIAHHVIQCQQAWATANAIPSAILYIDLRAAFYTVIRQTFTALPCKNQAFMQAMATLGIPIQDIAALLAALPSSTWEVALVLVPCHLSSGLGESAPGT